MAKTVACVVVVHRRTGRAYSYNDDFEVLEPLILDLEVFRYKSVRQFWKPMVPNTPAWAARIRDTEFDSFWVR